MQNISSPISVRDFNPVAVILASVFPGAVGLAILTFAWFQPRGPAASLGLFWLLAGGVITFIMCCWSIAILICGLIRRNKNVILLGLIGLLLSAANLGIAKLCMQVGSRIVEATVESD